MKEKVFNIKCVTNRSNTRLVYHDSINIFYKTLMYQKMLKLRDLLLGLFAPGVPEEIGAPGPLRFGSGSK